MITPTYKVGDKVIVRSDIRCGMKHGWTFTPKKEEIKGKVCTIYKVLHDVDCVDGYCYVIKSDEDATELEGKTNGIFVKEWLKPYKEYEMNISRNELMNILGE